MLDNLKRDIRAKHEVDFVTTAVIEAVADDSIKSAFLDDPEGVILGAESDPEVAALVADIPEYDENDQEAIAEIESATENWVLEALSDSEAQELYHAKQSLAVEKKALSLASDDHEEEMHKANIAKIEKQIADLRAKM